MKNSSRHFAGEKQTLVNLNEHRRQKIMQKYKSTIDYGIELFNHIYNGN